jgi:hypothetical protein
MEVVHQLVHQMLRSEKRVAQVVVLIGAGWADCPVPAVPVRIRVK